MTIRAVIDSANPEGRVVDLNGVGSRRPAEEPEAQRWQPNQGGTRRASIHNGEAAVSVERATSSADFQAPPSSILDTATDQHGFPLRRDQINEDSLIRLPDGRGQWRVGELLSTGELVKLPDGSYGLPDASRRDPSGDDPSSSPEQGEQHELLPVEGAEGLLTRVGELTDPGTAAKVVEFMAAGGDAEEGLIHQLAAQWGCDTETAGQTFEALQDAFSDQAYQAVAEYGIDPESVFDWAWRALPEQMGEAIRNQLYDRRADGYRAIAQSYMEQLDQLDPDAILAADLGEAARQAGVQVRKADDGQVIVFIPGEGWTTWRTALQFGLLKVGAAKRAHGGRR